MPWGVCVTRACRQQCVNRQPVPILALWVYWRGATLETGHVRGAFSSRVAAVAPRAVRIGRLIVRLAARSRDHDGIRQVWPNDEARDAFWGASPLKCRQPQLGATVPGDLPCGRSWVRVPSSAWRVQSVEARSGLRPSTDDRRSCASRRRVERGDRVVERCEIADASLQASFSHPLDDLAQLRAIGLDDEVDRSAAGRSCLGRSDDGHQRFLPHGSGVPTASACLRRSRRIRHRHCRRLPARRCRDQ